MVLNHLEFPQKALRGGLITGPILLMQIQKLYKQDMLCEWVSRKSDQESTFCWLNATHRRHELNLLFHDKQFCHSSSERTANSSESVKLIDNEEMA